MKLKTAQIGSIRTSAATQEVFDVEHRWRRATSQLFSRGLRLPAHLKSRWLYWDNQIDRLVELRNAYMLLVFTGGSGDMPMNNLMATVETRARGLVLEGEALIALVNHFIDSQKKPS